MPSAPTTRPSHKQSARSFLTLMLVVTTWPQKTKPGTGAEPTFHENFAGDGSMLPVRSIARTWKVRMPTGMPLYDCGDVHGSQSLNCSGRSSAHSNLAVESSLENANVASVRTVFGSGAESIVVSGGVTSACGWLIVHVRAAGVGSTLPFRSIAATSNVCTPGERPRSLRPRYVIGVVQDSK